MVLGDSAVAAVYADALRAFAQIAGPLHDRPRFEVVSRLRMGEIRRQYEPIGPADAQSMADGYHVLGFFVRAQGRSAIYVERALPRGLLLGTFAHELGHAWQATQAPDLRDPLLCEGFAEWVAHSVLSASGLRAMAARAARRDDLYGRGLRHYLQIELHRGRRRRPRHRSWEVTARDAPRPIVRDTAAAERSSRSLGNIQDNAPAPVTALAQFVSLPRLPKREGAGDCRFDLALSNQLSDHA